MEKIAIIGLSCLFPDAQTIEQFWQNLMVGKDSTSTVTQAQMGVEPDLFYDPSNGKLVEPGNYYCKRGGYIKDFQFDPVGYQLDPQVLTGLDRIYQWVLYTVRQALQDCNALGNSQALANCGVILGSLSVPTPSSQRLVAPLYQQVIDLALQELLQQPELTVQSDSSDQEIPWINGLTSSYLSAIATQALGLGGIHFTFDAACASSIFAIKLASAYLLSGKADLMLAGAVSAGDPWVIHNAFSLFQAYPASEISHPLDQTSDGLLTAEGAGIVALKRYSDALREGDRIYAVIAGIGLSNDGKGKHFFSPSAKGQRLAFERAYVDADLEPQQIDYVECHATGTPLGDRTELNTMEAFFQGATPLIGSVKSNLGHLLTAAGMPSLIKVILSMNKGVIPPTIGVEKPLSAANNGISAAQIIREAMPWPRSSEVKRAAVSAFGFGGTNSHLILEQGLETTTLDSIDQNDPLPLEKIAIVGMDAYFGTCDGLDAFERCIYQGKQPFIPLPEQRWQGIEALPTVLKAYGIAESAPVGAYIQDFEIDALQFKIPPDPTDQPNPQQLLILKVADRALADAGLAPGKTVAVIVAMAADLSIHQWRSRSDLSWQIRDGLNRANIALPEAQVKALIALVSDSLQPPVKLNLALSNVSGNLAASRISAQWDFTGPAFTLSAAENSVFKALEVAQLLLSDPNLEAVVVGAVDLAGSVENVLLRQSHAPMNTGIQTLGFDDKVNGLTVGEGAGAVVLQRLSAARENHSRIYAVIDSLSLIQEHNHPTLDKVVSGQLSSQFSTQPMAAKVTQVCQQARQQAGIEPEKIGYLEVFASGIEAQDIAEIQGLTQAYHADQGRFNCAIGSVKANIGHTGAASGMASLIKTALCVYHQYIPATPQWVSPKQTETLKNSPFYVPAESRLWFLPEQTTQRLAAMNSLGRDGSYAHLILAEEPSRKDLRNPYLEQTPFYLLPLAAFNRADLLGQLDELQSTLATAESLPQFAGQVFAEFQRKSEATYALAIAGHSQPELNREIERAKLGIEQAFAESSDWKTPLGSYFTAHPQGQQGGVAFVYPGAFTSYVGLCSSLHRFFPRIVDALAIFSDSDRIRKLMDQASRRVYPRSLEKLRPRQLEKLETQLHEDATTMLLFGTGVAVGLTSILREYFQVQPQAAFGYSLGELSMMYALNVFTSADAIAEHLHNSPLFQTRLSGPKQAVQEFWGLPSTSTEADFWGTYVLLSDPQRVREQLEHEPRVYLTHINTPTEVVIAGDNAACQRVIQKLACDYFPAPSKHVLHCEAMRSELDELTDWFTLPTQKVPQIEFYSAATYGRTGQGSANIAQSIATALCQPLDFPHLVDQVYVDGARVFIELGPAGTCARWIGETLQNKDHATVTLNTRGVDDHTATLRALTKLVSHRVPLDLSPLYAPLATTPASPAKTLANTLTLGRQPIHSSLLSAANRAKFMPRSAPASSVAEQPQPVAATSRFVTQPTVNAQSSYSESVASAPHPASSNEKSTKAVANPSHPFRPISLPFKVQPHATFLQMRQESLRKISQLMELQMAVAGQMSATPNPTSDGTNQPGLPKMRPVPFRKTNDPGKGTSAPYSKQPHGPTSGKNFGQSASHTPNHHRPPLLNEAAVLELAAGKLTPVWGPDYAVIDTYVKRVRLPMPPYLFINRVTRLEAERGCFQPCFIETEYDIPADAWYAVNGQVPAAIFVEASQGNMVLISYLGIDFETQGQRSFRALDGTITFIGAIPRAGETFRCEVRINSFTRGSGTLLYFYSCDYFVGDRKFLEVKAGAGFFTAQDLQKAPGVVLTKQEIAARNAVQKQQFTPLLSCPKTVFNQQDLLQLSIGNLAACFGVEYALHQARNPSLRLPLPAFRMIDRVVSVNPQGGIWGLGLLVAAKDLHPEQWYFNCHFKDDYCMPGTVIGEGAAQLLQFYLLYLGLLAGTTKARFHPIPNLTQSSRSRGQVTPQHGTLIYEMEVVEVGLKPVPYAKAEVLVKLKDKTISMIKNLGIQLWEEQA